MRIGFLGGTGIEGKGLALRFAHSGVAVLIGSRLVERARSAADAYNALLGKASIEGVSNPEMLKKTNVVFLTVPFDQAPSALESVRDQFVSGQILVDVTVPVRFRGGRPEYVESVEKSNAEKLRSMLPSSVDLVAAFKTLPAHVLAELEIPLHCDIFVCGDSTDAKQTVMDLVRQLPDVRPLDAGPLDAARALERMTLLAIYLNRRYRRKGSRFRVEGID